MMGGGTGTGFEVTEVQNKEIVKRGTSLTGIDQLFTFKKNRLNSRIKELLWDGSCPNQDLAIKVLNSLPNNLSIGGEEDISIEQVGWRGIKIYPTDPKEEFVSFVIPYTTVYYLFGEKHIDFMIKSGKDIYKVMAYNRRPYVDKLHTIKLEEIK